MCYVRTHLVEEIAHPVLRVIKREVPDARRDVAVVNAGLHYGIGTILLPTPKPQDTSLKHHIMDSC